MFFIRLSPLVYSLIFLSSSFSLSFSLSASVCLLVSLSLFLTPSQPVLFPSGSTVQFAGARAQQRDPGWGGELQGGTVAPPQPAGAHAVRPAPAPAETPGTHPQVLQRYVHWPL